MMRPLHALRSLETLEARDVPATTYDLGVATDFNLFAFQNVDAFTSDIEGRVAVGNDARFYAYGIGDKLPNSFGTRDDLIVGNDLDFTNGQVYFGNIVYGNEATLESIGIPNGDERQEEDVIDFATAQQDLMIMSNVLGNEFPNGITRFTRSNLNLRGTNQTLNFFTLNPDHISRARSINVMVPFGSTVVINVPGDSVSIQNLGLQLRGVDCSLVLWNFHQATELNISGVGLKGSVLAPNAALNFNNGHIQGTVIVDSMFGNGQINLCTSRVSVEIPDYANLQGVVFIDENGNNERDNPADETGLDDVEVVLTGTDILGRKIKRSFFTVNEGIFDFANLWPGTYAIKVVPPQRYQFSNLLGIPGTVDGTTIGTGIVNSVRTITLGEGDLGIDYLLPLLPEPN